MMKYKGLLVLFICIVILSGCRVGTSDNVQGTNKPITQPKINQSETKPISKPNLISKPKINNIDNNAISIYDLTTEESIREYLIGEWTFEKEYVSDVVCKMHIDKDLNIDLSFHDRYIDEAKGDYSGKIEFDRINASLHEAPDILCVDLNDRDNPGGDFFFLHRTTYDGKIVMSWFFAGNGNSIFDILVPDDFVSIPEEIMFEKTSGEMSKLDPFVDTEFYGVLWGKGIDGKSLWIDDVHWPGWEEYVSRVYPYPRRMALYDNDIPESILYNIPPDRVEDILGDDLFPGEIYMIKTDNNGNITHLKSVEYDLDQGDGENQDYEIEVEIGELVFDIIENDVEEIQEHLKAGMTILFDGEIITLDGEDCYAIVLGTNHEEHFVQEIFYAVNIFTRQVYRYDALTDAWEVV